ncbi:MAG: flagellar assembly protein FliW [Acidimicrobiales bacterium]|nr:flagellar assembly protein FliW [Acidimicrobiales bacterium]MCB9392757.1 flagellar assembly protein FliW [Acidimicrobiaceae bacterium]
MQVHTRRFGSIVVDDDEVYAVPNGIPGFPELRRVVLLGAGPAPGVNPGDDSSLYWMQDLDDGDLAFMCLVPWEIFPDYEIDIDERTLGIAEEADVRILSLVTVHRTADTPHLTANLRAPLVVDVGRRRVQQVILSDSRWPIRAPFGVLDADDDATVPTSDTSPSTAAV